MENSNMSRTQKITLSAIVMALYIVVLYFTQSFSFGTYQIRIATMLYGLAYLFPFLVLPLGFANCLSNILFGGLGPLDLIGGCIVGIVTTALIVLIRKKNWNRFWMIIPIIVVPGFGVSSYLSYLLNVPYFVQAISLCIGQVIPAICAPILIGALQKAMYSKRITN